MARDGKPKSESKPAKASTSRSKAFFLLPYALFFVVLVAYSGYLVPVSRISVSA
jgi:hypothetical protein